MRLFVLLAWTLLTTNVNFAAEPQSNVQCFGTVVDQNQRPVAGASVAAVGLYRRPPIRHDFPGRLATKTDQNGKFAIDLKRHDRRFLYHTSFLLIIKHDGHRTLVKEVSHLRCLANAPIDVTIALEPGTALRIVDAENHPVSGAKVSMARYGNRIIPHGATSQTATTDSAGTVTISGIPEPLLAMVYVESEHVGNQCLSVARSDDGSLRAVVKPTMNESGRVVMVDPDRDARLDGLTITLIAAERELDDEAPYTWCQTETDGDGSFENCSLSAGKMTIAGDFPDSFPFIFDSLEVSLFQRPERGQPIEVELHPAIKVIGTLREEGTGEPIPNVCVNHASRDGKPTISDSRGRFEFWAGPGRISYYPIDAWQHFQLPKAFNQSVDGLASDGVVRADAEDLQVVSPAEGMVRDENGNSVAGAEIVCIYAMERFTKEQKLFSDPDGRFRFYGIPHGATVTLTATAEGRITEAPVEAIVNRQADVTLIVKPRHAARFSGTVVDHDGRGVARALVNLRKPKVTKKESFRGVDRQAVPVFDDAILVMTDAEGRFLTPPVLDWDQLFSLTIQSPGFRTFHNYWHEPFQSGQTGEDFDFGKLTLHHRAEEIRQDLRIVSRTDSQPIADARVIFLGARTGRATGMTNEEGLISINRRDGRQLLGVWKRGFVPELRVIEPGERFQTIRLVAEKEAKRPNRAGKRPGADEIHLAAERLLDLVPPFDVTAPAYRQLAVCNAQLSVDFQLAVQQLKHSSAGFLAFHELRDQSWLDDDQLALIQQASERPNASVVRLLRIRRQEAEQKRSELIDQAIAEVTEVDDASGAILTARLAEVLLRIGRQETAVSLLRDAWKRHPEFRQIIDEGRQVKMVGNARIFAPVYAVADPDAALELIRLTALPDEVPKLRGKALVYLTVYAPGRIPVDLVAQQNEITMWGLREFQGKPPLFDVSSGLKLLSKMETSPAKSDHMLMLAGNLSGKDAAVRQLLCREALEMFFVEHGESAYSSNHPCVAAAKAAVMIEPWDPILADQYAFASLWACRGATKITPFHLTSSLATALAPYDKTLARALVEPCFDDWSWQFGDRDGSGMFFGNEPIRAAAAIDPGWAIDEAESLFANQLKDHLDRRYGIVGAIGLQLLELPR